VRTFLIIWLGQFVSRVGTAMTRFALLIWAYQQTGAVTTVALLGFFGFLPYVLLSPVAGVWVDRLDRRKVMLLADLGSGIVTAALMGLYFSGGLAIWHLYAAEALTAALDAFQGPAYSAASTVLLPKELYGRAGGLRSMADDGARILAPFPGRGGHRRGWHRRGADCGRGDVPGRRADAGRHARARHSRPVGRSAALLARDARRVRLHSPAAGVAGPDAALHRRQLLRRADLLRRLAGHDSSSHGGR
jgi:hypothetical protein